MALKRAGIVLGAWLLAAGSAAAEPAIPSSVATVPDKTASDATARFTAWVVASGDNQDRPFIVVDKPGARILLFTREGRLEGAAPALLGLARGDRSAPGIGTRALSAIAPHERTTPAGRFEAALGQGVSGKDILWIDYDAAISLHRVITGGPRDRRLQRLATPDPLDNRISYGCINVPVAFYETLVRPAFLGRVGIVYVLPDTEPLAAIFPAYDLAARRGAARSPS